MAELLWSSRLGVPCEILEFVADSHRHAPNKYLSSSALQRPCWELLEREGYRRERPALKEFAG